MRRAQSPNLGGGGTLEKFLVASMALCLTTETVAKVCGWFCSCLLNNLCIFLKETGLFDVSSKKVNQSSQRGAIFGQINHVMTMNCLIFAAMFVQR